MAREPGLTVPLVAVTRVNGRFFVFMAEKDGQATIARQRPVELGPLVGNDYVVLDGLERRRPVLIVSGIQKIGDGAPVAPQAAAAAAAAPASPAAK